MNLNIKLQPGCEDLTPVYGTSGAAGLDLRADGPYTLLPGESCFIGCGLAVEIPEGYFGLLAPRSGLATRYHVRPSNTPGVIDSDYRDTLRVHLYNEGEKTFEVERGDRIAQLLIIPCPPITLVLSDDLSQTARNLSGFGSTGVK